MAILSCDCQHSRRPTANIVARALPLSIVFAKNFLIFSENFSCPFRNPPRTRRIYCIMSTQNGTKNRYFGTDGIRGVYGESLTDSIALLVGGSLGLSSKGGTVVVGRDNRLSGESLARALAEGVLAAGGNVPLQVPPLELSELSAG